MHAVAGIIRIHIPVGSVKYRLERKIEHLFPVSKPRQAAVQLVYPCIVERFRAGVGLCLCNVHIRLDNNDRTRLKLLQTGYQLFVPCHDPVIRITYFVYAEKDIYLAEPVLFQIRFKAERACPRLGFRAVETVPDIHGGARKIRRPLYPAVDIKPGGSRIPDEQSVLIVLCRIYRLLRSSGRRRIGNSGIGRHRRDGSGRLVCRHRTGHTAASRLCRRIGSAAAAVRAASGNVGAMLKSVAGKEHESLYRILCPVGWDEESHCRNRQRGDYQTDKKRISPAGYVVTVILLTARICVRMTVHRSLSPFDRNQKLL